MFKLVNMETMAYVLAFLTTTGLVYGIIQVLLGLRRDDRKRFERRLAHDLGSADEQRERVAQKFVRERDEEQKSALARWLPKTKLGMSFRRLCEQAALPWPAHHVLIFLGFCVLLFLLLVMLFQLPFAALLLGVVLVVGLPILAISYMRTLRTKKLNAQLPDVFDLLSQALRAGHSLQAGFELVATQVPEPAGREFGQVFAEQGLGVPLEVSLMRLAERVDLLEIRMFVTAVQIQRQTGGDLTEVMDKIGRMIRERLAILGQVQALTAEGRLSGWILVGLPIVVLFVLFMLNPSYPNILISTSLGKKLLMGVAISQTTGMLWIRKIVNIKV